MENEPTTMGRTQRTQSRKKRLRAHVDYTSMSVSYGRVKLGVPSGFKEMLETVTREILHEQPKDIPAFLEAYFTCLNEEQQKGSVLNSLVTQRIVEVRAVEESNNNTESSKESAVTEVQTEAPASQTDACNATESQTQVDASISTENQQQQDACEATIPTSTSDVQVEANEQEIAQKTSHISVNSVSDLPKDFKMVNCEVICKESAEELQIEANEKSVEEEEEKEEEPKSLEQMEACKEEIPQAEEEIIEEEEEPEEKPRKSIWDSQQHFTPDEPEEIEREAPQDASGEQSLEQQDHEHVNYDELENSRPATANEAPEEKSQPTETNEEEAENSELPE